MSFLYWMAVVVVFLGALAAWAFIPLFHFTAAWWKTFVGRHFMVYSLAIALLYTRGVWSFFTTEPKEPDPVNLALTCFVTFAVVWRVVVYVRLERMKRRDDNELA